MSSSKLKGCSGALRGTRAVLKRHIPCAGEPLRRCGHSFPPRSDGTCQSRLHHAFYRPRRRHICIGTGRTPATSVSGLGSPLPASAPGLGSPLPTSAPGRGSPLPTSAPGPGSPLPTSASGTGLIPCPHLRRDGARPCPHLHPGLGSSPAHICAGTGLARSKLSKRSKPVPCPEVMN